MRNLLKSFARALANIPIVGRIVHVAVATYRLPELRGYIYERLTPEVAAARQSTVVQRSESSGAIALLERRLEAEQRRSEADSTALRSLGDHLVEHAKASHAQSMRMDAVEGYIRELSDLAYGISRRLDGETVRFTSLEAHFSMAVESISTLNSRLDLEIAPVKKSFPVALRLLRGMQRDLERRIDTVGDEVSSAGEVLSSRLATVESRLPLAESRVDAFESRQSVVDAGLGDLIARQRDVDARMAPLVPWLEALTGDVRNVREATVDVPTIRTQVVELASAVRDRDQRLGSLEAETHADAARLAALDQRLEQLSASGEANKDLRKSVGYLLERVEFVRRELMFEIRYGGSRISGNPQQMSLDPRVVDEPKLASARDDPAGIRLNLGSGHLLLDGYLNVDLRDLPGVDIVADVGKLPFGPGEVSEISSSHVLEHFPQEQLRRVLLPYWRDLLKTGGRFRAVVPDIEAMMDRYAKGEYSYDEMREVIYGAQDYDGDFHYNMFTPDSLSRLLDEAGFVAVVVPDRARKNGLCLEFEIQAKRV